MGLSWSRNWPVLSLHYSSMNIIMYAVKMFHWTMFSHTDTQLIDLPMAMMCHHMLWSLCCQVSLRQNMPWRWAVVRTPIWSCLKENCRAVKNIVLQNRQSSTYQIADTVGSSTGSVKTILREQSTCWWQKSVCDESPKCLTRKWGDKSLYVMGPQNVWPENERLLMHSIK